MSQMEYENEQFESESMDEKKHLLKLSIDFLTIKDLKYSANISVQYAIKLTQVHSFKSSPATPVNQNQEVKLANAFASYDFQASKTELFSLLNDSQLQVKVIHQDKAGSQSDIGTASVELKEILNAPMKKTPQAVVRVSDQYLPIQEGSQIKGLIRCIIYLQDLGEVLNQQPSRQPAHSSVGQENMSPNQPNSEYQAVWQLEVWKRSEEAKFKAYLKQKEIERIEEITYQWKNKEAEREKTFTESLQKITQLEQKVRTKALDLQKREANIMAMEEDLKHKIFEVSRQLTLKEEEIMNVKKRFKEERVLLESDKKRLTQQLEEYKGRLEQAETRLYSFKKEVDESPLSVLRQELAQKNLEMIEMDNKLKTANEQREEFRKKFEQIKKDMITLKKQLDNDKAMQLTRQAEELEKLKTEMRNKQAQEDERRELQTLRMQIATLTNKMSQTNVQQQQVTNNQVTNQITNQTATINDRMASYNPFYQPPTQASIPNVFLDNFARNQASPTKETGKSFGHMMNGAISMNSDVDRIVRERQDLLKTGAYTEDDPLIIELDRQIRAMQLRIN